MIHFQKGAIIDITRLYLWAGSAAVMAKRRITQDTFDAVVGENIEEFDMEASEALKEAIEQFESQGKWHEYW